MTITSMPWALAGGGDHGPYTDTEWAQMQSDMFVHDPSVQGIFPAGTMFAVTNPAGLTIRTAAGSALVNGRFVRNTADIDKTVVAPGVGTNYYAIVIRVTYATQTPSVEILGPSTVSTPVPTQDTSMWELEIAAVSVTSGGVVSITDKRVAIGSLTIGRQGDPASADWNMAAVPGVVGNYAPSAAKIQVGDYRFAVGGHSGICGITFPAPYTAGQPVAFVQITDSGGSGSPTKALIIDGITTDLNGVTFHWQDIAWAGEDYTWIEVVWQSIGAA